MRCRYIFVLLASFTITGCANVIEKPYQNIVVNAGAVKGVDCILENDDFKYRTLTPGEITVERSSKDLKVLCNKSGYEPTHLVVPSRLRLGASFVNIFNGLVPGMAYDVASHSVYAYPANINIVMIEKPVMPSAPEAVTPALQKKPTESTPDIAPVTPPPAEKTMSESLKK